MTSRLGAAAVVLLVLLAGCPDDPTSPAGTAVRSLRCGDLITRDDLEKLGLDSPRFDPNESQTDPVLGVRCELGPKISAALFLGEQFPTMAADLKAALASGQIKSHPGPTFGGETYWTWLGERHGLLFLSSNERFAASLSGRDQELLERLAARLDARMKQR